MPGVTWSWVTWLVPSSEWTPRLPFVRHPTPCDSWCLSLFFSRAALQHVTGSDVLGEISWLVSVLLGPEAFKQVKICDALRIGQRPAAFEPMKCVSIGGCVIPTTALLGTIRDA